MSNEWRRLRHENGTDHQVIEVRGFKWPRRATAVGVSYLLGEDTFGRWLGIPQGNPWWDADRSRSGVYEAPFVKLVPSGTFWTVCFNLDDPVIDVDIVVPVQWVDDALEEVDLELDILRFADGSVRVRDRDEFDRVREAWPMPDDIVARAEETCERVFELVEMGAEPFADVGRAWLTGFLAEVE